MPPLIIEKWTGEDEEEGGMVDVSFEHQLAQIDYSSISLPINQPSIITDNTFSQGLPLPEDVVVLPQTTPNFMTHPYLIIRGSRLGRMLLRRLVGRPLPADGVVLPQSTPNSMTHIIGGSRLGRMVGRLFPDGVFPQSTLHFIIIYLVAFVEIKSQDPDFPFITHRKSVLVAVIGAVMYGFTSAAEHIATPGDQHHVTNFQAVARTGRILCLFLLVATLTYLACFLYVLAVVVSQIFCCC